MNVPLIKNSFDSAPFLTIGIRMPNHLIPERMALRHHRRLWGSSHPGAGRKQSGARGGGDFGPPPRDTDKKGQSTCHYPPNPRAGHPPTCTVSVVWYQGFGRGWGHRRAAHAATNTGHHPATAAFSGCTLSACPPALPSRLPPAPAYVTMAALAGRHPHRYPAP